MESLRSGLHDSRHRIAARNPRCGFPRELELTRHLTPNYPKEESLLD
jgi:hypothetical protein